MPGFRYAIRTTDGRTLPYWSAYRLAPKGRILVDGQELVVEWVEDTPSLDYDFVAACRVQDPDALGAGAGPAP